MVTQAVPPELASVHRLDPFDFQLADVRRDLLYARGVGLAAISQIREAHHSVAMDVVHTQALPVIHHAVEIADHPNHLRNMMVDGRIEHGV